MRISTPNSRSENNFDWYIKIILGYKKTYFRNREKSLEFRFTVVMVSDLGSGVSVWTSDMFSVRGNVVCLVGVLCGSFLYEKPILGSGFETCCICILAGDSELVFGDFRRIGTFGVISSLACAWKFLFM